MTILVGLLVVVAILLGGCGFVNGSLNQDSLIKDLSNDPAAACITGTYGPAAIKVIRAMPGAKVTASLDSCTVEYAYPAAPVAK